MNMRNLLKAGSFVYAVPVGTPMTLQYNVDGNLEKVHIGIGENLKDVTKEIMVFMIEKKTVPPHLKVAGGTTFVSGVLYSGAIPDAEMSMAELQNYMYEQYKADPGKYNFFGFDIDCTATRISGGLSMQSTLAMNKFNTLQVQTVPAVPTDETVNMWLHSQYWNFIPGLCMGFYCTITDPKYIPMNIQSIVVKKIERITDENGIIKAIINSSTGIRLNVDYSKIVNSNIAIGDTLYLDYNNDIAFIMHKKPGIVSDTISCDFCGRRFKVPHFGEVMCPDAHCLSKVYPTIQRFLSAFGLPTLEYNRYKALVDSNEITTFSDVMLLPEYKDVVIETTLGKLMRALISTRLIRSSDVLTQFADATQNNIKTFIFYLDHPDKIARDLNIHHVDTNRMVAWISDSENASTLKTLVMSENFKINKTDTRFEGAPILRNKKLCITGSFIHGDYSEVSAILRSYSAEVTTEFDADCSAVIIGGMQENTSGEILKAAKSLSIPVFDETAFFDRYEIDSDLRNLV